MSTTVAFTICSINYLAQAITLGNSLKQSNPEVDFRIYLVDKFEGREHIKGRIPFKVIEIENVPVADFAGMCVRYNIIELNTAVKPFIIEHIFNAEESVKNVIFFDPDIEVFGNLKMLLKKLEDNSLVLTPHLLNPSEEHPYGQAEKNYLLAGTFNLGFIAVSRNDESFRFLKWWQNRLVNQSYSKEEMHLFYDQKWLNLAVVFFDGVNIEKSPGYNMAGWNLHEREITDKVNGRYVVNNNFELIFFHYSGVRVNKQNISDYSRYSFEDRPDLEEIIKGYRQKIISNGDEFFRSFKCYYLKFYKGMTIYYPKYHWITIYRRTRFNLGKLRRLIFKVDN